MSDDDPRTMEELLADTEWLIHKQHHLLRLGADAIRLLGRCYVECDMEPDLSVDVGTLLLRIHNLPADPVPPSQRG